MQIFMKERANVRQHAHDKMVIDHLTSGPGKPDMAGERKQKFHKFTERDGHELDKAIGRKWTPNKGGLPDF